MRMVRLSAARVRELDAICSRHPARKMVTVRLNGSNVRMSAEEAHRLETSGVEFAYVCKRDGITIMVPVN